MPKPSPKVSLTLPCVSLKAKISKVTLFGSIWLLLDELEELLDWLEEAPPLELFISLELLSSTMLLFDNELLLLGREILPKSKVISQAVIERLINKSALIISFLFFIGVKTFYIKMIVCSINATHVHIKLEEGFDKCETI